MKMADMLPVEALFSQAAMLSHGKVVHSGDQAELECARAIVEQELSLKMDQRSLPSEISIRLNEAWKDVLATIYLEDGYGSVRWELAMEITDELLWTLTPKTTMAERSKMIAMLPTLVKALRQGLRAIAWDDQQCDRLFSSLEKCHMAFLQGKRLVKRKKSSSEREQKPPQPKTICQIELLEGIELDEDFAPLANAQVEQGWVYRPDSNEWVYIGEPVQALAVDRDAPSKQSAVHSSRNRDLNNGKVRKLGSAGDR